MLRTVLVVGLCVGFALCDTLFFRPFDSWGKGNKEGKNGPNPLCPDKQGTCPEKSTCCKLVTGKYGCCPLPHAVCCSDHTHCCPEGFTCDVSAGSCKRGNMVIDWLQPISSKSYRQPGAGLKHEPANKKPLVKKPGAGLKTEPANKKPVTCPGGHVECPEGSTCCQLQSKAYGCCPMLNAVCCSDKQHCCPKGYKCTPSSTCAKTQGQGTVSWIELVLGKNRQDNKVSKSSKTTNERVIPSKESSYQKNKLSHPKATVQNPSSKELPRPDDEDNDEDDSEEDFQQHKGKVFSDKSRKDNKEKIPVSNAQEIGKPKPVSKKAKENMNVKINDGIGHKGGYGIKPLPKHKGDVKQANLDPKDKPGRPSAAHKGETKFLSTSHKGVQKNPSVEHKGHPKVATVGHKGATKNPTEGHKGIVRKPVQNLKKDQPSKNVGASKTASITAGAKGTNPPLNINKGGQGPNKVPAAKMAKQFQSVKTPPLQQKKLPGTKQQVTQIGKKPTKQVIPKLPVKQVLPPKVISKHPSSSQGSKVSAKPSVPSANIQSKITKQQATVIKQQSAKVKVQPKPVISNPTATVKQGIKTAVNKPSQSKMNPNQPAVQGKKMEVKAAIPAQSKQPFKVPVKNPAKEDIDLDAAPTGVRKLVYKLGMMTQKIKKLLMDSLLDNSEDDLDQPDKPDKDIKGKESQHEKKSSKNSKISKNQPEKAKSMTSKKPVDKKDKVTVPAKHNPVINKSVKSLKDSVEQKPKQKINLKTPQNPTKPAQISVTSKQILKNPVKVPASKKPEAISKMSTQKQAKEKTPVSAAKPKQQPIGQTKVPLPKPKSKVNPPSRVIKPVAKDVPAQKTTQSVGIKKPVKTNVIDGIPSANLKVLKQQLLKRQQELNKKQQQKVNPPFAKQPVGKPQVGKQPVGKPQVGKQPVGKPLVAKPPLGKPVIGKQPLAKLPIGKQQPQKQKVSVNIPKTKLNVNPKKKESQIAEKQKKPRGDNVGAVLCPGSGFLCASNTTCCPTPTGSYRCCPIPNGFCCPDAAYCCAGHGCYDGAPGCYTTVQAQTVTDFLDEIISPDTVLGESHEPTELQTLSSPTETPSSDNSVTCPGGKFQCPEQSTCCMSPDKSWGCCPLKKASCCNDGKHCCPSGYKCDLSAGKCDATENSNPKFTKMLKKVAALPVNVAVNKAVVCQGGKFQCPSGNTCCKTPDGTYACCPLPKAVCCADGVHCCPHGNTCDMKKGQCVRSPNALQALLKQESQEPKPETEKKCPDNVSKCPDQTTCCKMKNGYYGCCQYDQAICCSDLIHCCPSDMHCNVTTGTCSNQFYTLKFGEPESAKKPILQAKSDLLCPDKTSCPEKTTCCEMPSGGYGCCPFENAKCCADHTHCCPSDEDCDVKEGKCVHQKTEARTPWQLKIKSFPIPELYEKNDPLDNTVCPDHKTMCYTGKTCCPVDNKGGYGCCPLPNAVCCSDDSHCCPQHSKCDLKQGTCVSEDGQVTDWLEKEHSHQENMPIAGSLVSDVSKKVVCPGSTSTCEEKQTCCKLSSGEWGCCPYEDATCCSDGKSCCPKGFKCDLTSKKCTEQQDPHSVPWFTKRPALPTGQVAVGGVICPDKSQCSSGSSCCKTMSGQYGCCPLPNAVCCSDGLHCCPTNTKCDVKAGRCLSSEINSLSTSWYTMKRTLKFVPEGQFGAVVKDNDKICPGKKARCPFKQTCCKLNTGDYGCCPLADAVCCSDGKHCCSHGSTCDPATGMCESATAKPNLGFKVSLSLGEILPAGTLNSNTSPGAHISAQEGDVICPDQQHCLDGQTCCKQTSGQYGCCPLPNAVCCSDGLHCCPQDTTCDLAAGKCNGVTNSLSVTWSLVIQRPQIMKSTSVKTNIVCPDKKSQCDAGQTCCKLNTGKYGCCPMESAVCCSDGLHCCPQGTTCDLAAGKCNSVTNSLSVTWSLVIQKPALVKTNVCPDKKSECATGQTCCKLSTGGYGCCPLPSAVCCSDGLHCCPQGSTCDVKAGTCMTSSNGITTTWESTRPATRTTVNADVAEMVGHDVVCPDKKAECHHDNTCCKLQSGSYGCCPLPAAVCCSDGLHCCAHGTTCDVKAGTCKSTTNSFTVTWDRIQPKTKAMMNSNNAVSSELVGHDVVCPDKKAECHHDNTCCKLQSGSYGCCPLPAAVCCSDGLHCCAHGTTCDVKAGTCKSTTNSFTVTWDRIQPKTKAMMNSNNAVSSELVGHDVVCPDKKAECRHDNTCCKLQSGSYGCCPLPAAVCCSDGLHCCAHGTTCDVKAGTCKSTTNSFTVTWDRIQPKTKAMMNSNNAVSSELVGHDVVCPDKKAECHHDNTCCKLQSGSYGCCPLPAAVCCSDGLHCCAHGSTCDVKAGTCTSTNGIAVTWDRIQPKSVAMVNSATVVGTELVKHDVVCPDKKAECHHDNTCCKLQSGSYGCCPLPAAVCCSDGQHCCPHGTTCDGGSCASTTNSFTVSWDRIHPKPDSPTVVGTELVKHDVVCPDKKTQCHHDNTCCKLQSGSYGCCPLPAAVCCSDGLHCCPHGTTCDLKAGTCSSTTNSLTVSWYHLQKTVVPSKTLDNVNAIVCPDKTECPWSSTCCKSTDGKYTCCQGKNASCCADNVSCCPSGYTCAISQGTTSCKKAGVDALIDAQLHSSELPSTIPWTEKIQAQQLPEGSDPVTDGIICPDKVHECPNYTTCCKMGSDWGCCPLKQAVCCSDDKHCCPHGFSCDPQKMQCTRRRHP